MRDMGERPTLLHSVDRYPDARGNYEPSNCRWATKHEQAINRTDTNWVLLGERIVTFKEFEMATGLNRDQIYNGIRRGKIIKSVGSPWSPEVISGRKPPEPDRQYCARDLVKAYWSAVRRGLTQRFTEGQSR